MGHSRSNWDDIQLAQTRLTDLKAVIATKEAELAALGTERLIAQFNWAKQPTKATCNTLADNGNEAAASALALYKRGREEAAWRLESLDLQANIRALEIADAISYRRNGFAWIGAGSLFPFLPVKFS